MEASGTFDIKTEHLDISVEGNGGIRLNRMSIRKVFEGDLKGKSKGEMLAAMTEVKGSAGYVAIEQVNGEIGGKTGAFVLQHFGIMAGDNKRLILEVIPDSGTGGLTGITGTMTIIIENGQHQYKLDYQFDASK